MFFTKLSGIVCSVADIAFILILLKLSYFLKSINSGGPGSLKPRKRLAALYFFALLTPTMALPISTDMFLLWQSFVLGVPYLILAYSIVAEFPTLLRHMREQILPKL
jgi:hypothetical protein